jgi:hypothetical protein
MYDIVNHDWFAGRSTDPPFVPQLKDASDTACFARRYEFRAHEDASILDDIASELPINDNDDERAAFSAVNIDSLSDENKKIVQRTMSKSRSLSVLRDTRDDRQFASIQEWSSFMLRKEHSANFDLRKRNRKLRGLSPPRHHPINCQQTNNSPCCSERISKLSGHRAWRLNAQSIFAQPLRSYQPATC